MSTPRALKDSVRPRRLYGASGRPLNFTVRGHGRAGGNVKRYDPNRAPEPAEWLELDEEERIALVERFHRKMPEHAQSLKAHAIVHAAVETQLALNDPPGARYALTRLMGEGLDRHEALHAIGSVLAEYLFEALRGSGAKDTSNDAYAQALLRLTAASWRAL